MDHDPKAPARKPQRKRPKRRKTRPDADSAAARVQAAERSLSTAVRAAYLEMFGDRTEQARPFSLTVDIEVDPGNAWRLKADPPLEEQIRSSVQEMEVIAAKL